MKCGNVVPLGQALAFLFSLPGLQEMLAILWSPWLALLLASAWDGGAHHSSPWVSAIVVPARSPRPPPPPHLCPARQRLVPPVPHAQGVEEPLRPGEAGDLTCLHPFIDASNGSDLIGWSPDLKGWDTWIQDVEKSLGEYRACLPKRAGSTLLSSMKCPSWIPQVTGKWCPKSYSVMKTRQNCRN